MSRQPSRTSAVAGESSPAGSAYPEGSGEGRRLLLVKFGAIGDVIMAIPAAAARYAAGFQVDWVCSEAVSPILRLYPWIHVIAVNERRLLRGSVRERGFGMLGLWRTLRRRVKLKGGYDLIATLYYDRRYRLLSAPVRAGRRVSLSRTDRRFLLLPGRHHTDEYDRILSGRADGEAPAQLAPIPAEGLPPPPRAVHPARVRVVLVPAGARNVLRDDALRRWPVAHYVALAFALIQEGYEVVLAGGPEDVWATAHFGELEATAGGEVFCDLIGRLSLTETLALLHSAAVTVTHDTGPLHLAGITSTGIVALFGPTDPHGRLPQRGNAVAIWGGAGFACRPCYDGREYARCDHNGCLVQVTPGMVLEEVVRLARARREGVTLPARVMSPAPERSVLTQIGGQP